jgi:DNA-binding MarR family transcriptional regulator
MPSRPPRRTAADRVEPAAAFDAADRLHSAAIHLLRRLRREDAGTGLTPPKLSALSVIVARGPIGLGALADAEQVRSPTMTRVVSELEQAGLVARSPDPHDRRGILLRATPRGRRAFDEGRRARVALLADDLGTLSRDELRAVTRALDVIEGLVGGRHGRSITSEDAG